MKCRLQIDYVVLYWNSKLLDSPAKMMLVIITSDAVLLLVCVYEMGVIYCTFYFQLHLLYNII